MVRLTPPVTTHDSRYGAPPTYNTYPEIDFTIDPNIDEQTSNDTNVRTDIDQLTTAKHNNPHQWGNGNQGSHYRHGSAKLAVAIDVTMDTFDAMLMAISERARQFKWENILYIRAGNDHKSKNLLSKYNEISMKTIRRDVLTYIQQSNQKEENSFMMFYCLFNSLTTEAHGKINKFRKECLIDDRTPSGPLYLRVLIRESLNSTNAIATLTRTCTRLKTVELLTQKVEAEITQFKLHICQPLRNIEWNTGIPTKCSKRKYTSAENHEGHQHQGRIVDYDE